jgi:5-methylcytosine-specific restriction endonuclease McrA
MTQDHIMPRVHGGEDKIENLQTMCRECNQRKGCTIPKGMRT